MQAQQVVNLENFEPTTWLPSGWSNVSASTNRWSRLSSSTFPTVSIGVSGIGFCRFQARGANNGTIQTLALPVADYRLRGSKTPHISFYMYRDSLSKNADSLSVYINTSASLTGAVHLGTIARYSRTKMPDTQIVNGWYLYSFNIPAAFNGATNYLMLKGYAQGGNSSNNIYIDSVSWDTYPIVCSGKPTGATISSNPEVICGGNGSATLNLNGSVATHSGITITWQWGSTNNGPWTTFGGNSLTAATGNLTISRFYRCILACSTSGLADTTGVYVMRVISTPKPTIVVTPNPVSTCSLGGPTLMIASGASSYVWSPATALNETKNDSVYTSLTTNGTYTVTGTDTQGCINSTNLNVTFRQSPGVNIIAADSVLCKGDSIRLTAQGGGITSYNWSPTGQTINSIWAKPDSNMRYFVTVKNAFNCSNSTSKKMYVKLPPKANFSFSNVGNVFHFMDSSKNASSWLWNFGDGNESKKPNPVYTFSGDTNYTVSLIVTGPPCTNDTFTTIIRGNPLWVKTQNQLSLRISPNPATNFIDIDFSSLGMIKNITFQDASGKEVTSLILTENFNSSLRVYLNQLPAGIYTLTAIAGDKKMSARIYKL